MLGKIVVHDQHVLARLHKIFAHGAARVGRDVLQRRGVARGGVHHDGVGKRVVLAQGVHQLRHRAGLLADCHINADDVLALLVEDGIQGHGGFAGLPVANDQLALAAADGEHAVDGQQAGFHGLVDRLAGDDVRRGGFDGAVMAGLDGALPVDGATQRVHHAAQEIFAHGHARHAARAIHQATLFHNRVVAKKDAADFVAIQVLHHAANAVGKQQNFAIECARQAGNRGDAVFHGEHSAGGLRDDLRLEILHGVADQRDHVLAHAAVGRHADAHFQLL